MPTHLYLSYNGDKYRVRVDLPHRMIFHELIFIVVVFTLTYLLEIMN